MEILQARPAETNPGGSGSRAAGLPQGTGAPEGEEGDVGKQVENAFPGCSKTWHGAGVSSES